MCQGFLRGKLTDASKCLNLKLEGGWDELSGGLGGLRERPGDALRAAVVPFVACSSLTGCDPSSVPGDVGYMDSDKSYAVSEAQEVRAPLAPPITPPYEAARVVLHQKKRTRGKESEAKPSK